MKIMHIVSQLKTIFPNNKYLEQLTDTSKHINTKQLRDMNRNKYHSMYFAIELVRNNCKLHKDLVVTLFKIVLHLKPTPCEYIIIAQYASSNKYLNNKAWGTLLYKKTLSKTEDVYYYDKYNIAKSILSKEYLGDKKWAKEICVETIENSDSKDSFYVLDMAINLNKNIKNNEWVRQLSHKILLQATDFMDIPIMLFDVIEIDKSFVKDYITKYISTHTNTIQLKELAYFIVHKQYFNDKKSAEFIYKKAFRHSTSKLEAILVIDSIYDNALLNNKKLALNYFNHLIHLEHKKESSNGKSRAEIIKDYFENIIQNTTCIYDLSVIVKIIKSEEYLNDESLIIEIYDSMTSKDSYPSAVSCIIRSIYENNIKIHKSWIKNHIQNAINSSKHAHHLEQFIDEIISEKYINDKVLGIIMYKKMLTYTNDSSQLCRIAQKISSKKHLNNKKWASEIYTDIINKQRSVSDIIDIANSIKEKDGLNNKKWANNIFKNPYKYLLKYNEEEITYNRISQT